MAGDFEATADGGAAIALDDMEISTLRSLAVQFLERIGPGPGEDEPADSLEALLSEGPTRPPTDPALARLFPEAYTDPAKPADAQAHALSAEFRRYTENELRARKRADALAMVRSLDALAASGEGVGGAVLRLDAAQARQWLGALNDLRLTMGTDLGVTEEDEELYRLPDSDTRKPMVLAYLWLGVLQETLVEALM